MIKICRRDPRRLRFRVGIDPLDFARSTFCLAAVSMCLSISSVARAESLVVIEARGIASTAGTLIDARSRLTLRQGEHVRLIGENGNQYCLDGPYDGPAKPPGTPSSGGTRRNLWNVGERDQADPLTDCIE